jgi:hypothetical protein
LGESAWYFDPSGGTTTQVGFADAMHTKADGYQFNNPTMINSAGQIVGFSYRYNGGSTQLGTDAWFYDTDLQQFSPLVFWVRGDGFADTRVFGLTEEGDVVGRYTGAAGNRAFLWSMQDGFQDLGDYIEGGLGLSDWNYLTGAYFYNSSGMLMGDGQLASGGSASFLLIPASVPEPGTFTLASLAIGLSALARRRRRSRV